ncbi:MAG: dTDP-4-dehydrorhamnose reductase [Betaproteobacteria bacterium]
MARPVILLLGAAGQLGHELHRSLAPLGDVIARSHTELDLADSDAVVAAVREIRPAIILNAAAYTAVDAAETEPERAHAINARAPGLLAEEARHIDAILLHYSTDYVFDGQSRSPYREDAPAAPLNVYGSSKLAGEEAIKATGAHALVFRTSWVYAARGTNFLLTIRRLAAECPELRIVADQIGTPNWARTLAEATARVVDSGAPAMRERSGVYHLSSEGSASWFDFARAIVGDAIKPRVVPITSAEFPRPAQRPAYAVLDTSKFRAAFGFALPSWRAELERCTRSPVA